MKTVWMLAGLVAGGMGMGPAMAQDLFSSKDTIVENEGAIGDRWQLAEGAQLAMPEYPPQMAAHGDNVCLALGYRIGKDGTTSDFRVLQQWSSGGEQEPVDGYWAAFAQSGADALSQWRFAPRAGVSPVMETYTVATLVFNAGEVDAGALRAHCHVRDLSAAIQEQKAKAYRTSMEALDLQRANRAAGSMPQPPMGGGSMH